MDNFSYLKSSDSILRDLSRYAVCLKDSSIRFGDLDYIQTDLIKTKDYLCNYLFIDNKAIIDGISISLDKKEQIVQLFNHVLGNLHQKHRTKELTHLIPISDMSSTLLTKLLTRNELYKTASPQKRKFLESLHPKNLGHLVGDSFIMGMTDQYGVPLEGNTLSETIQFLLTALDYLPTQYPQVFKDKQKEIENVMYLLVDALSNIGTLDVITAQTDPQKKQQMLLDYTDMIRHKIKKLKHSDTLVLPWGWSDPSRIGHAMLVTVKNVDGNLELDVFNTGSGADFHEMSAARNKPHANTIRHYRIPSDAKELFFKTTLQSMFEPRALGSDSEINQPMYQNRRYSAEELYLMLEPFYVSEQAKDGKSAFWKSLQQSGTCALQCVMAFFGSYTKGFNKELKFIWEQEVVGSILEFKDVFLKADPLYQVALSRVLPNLFRHLKKLQKAGLSDKECKRLLDRFERWQKEIEANYLPIVNRNPKINPLSQTQWLSDGIIREFEDKDKKYFGESDRSLSRVSGSVRRSASVSDDESYQVSSTSGSDDESWKVSLNRKSSDENDKVERSRKEWVAPILPLETSQTVDANQFIDSIDTLSIAFANAQDKIGSWGRGEWNLLRLGTPKETFFFDSCRQISSIFFDPAHQTSKEKILQELKDNPSQLKKALEKMDELVATAQKQNTLFLDLSNALYMHGIVLVAWELAVIKDDLEGLQGEERLDHYGLDIEPLTSLVEMRLTPFTFATPRVENDYYLLKKAYEKKSLDKKSTLFNFTKYRFGYDEKEKNSEFVYAAVHAKNLSPEDLQASHEDYCEFISQNKDAHSEEKDYQTCWIFANIKLPLQFQTVYRASFLANSCTPDSHLFLDKLSAKPQVICERGELSVKVKTDFSQEFFNDEKELKSLFLPHKDSSSYSKGKRWEDDLFGSWQNSNIVGGYEKRPKDLLKPGSISAVPHPLNLTMLTDFYHGSLELLAEPVHRIFFERIFASPGNLLTTIRKNPAAIEDLVRFFQEISSQFMTDKVKLSEEDCAIVYSFLLEKKVVFFTLLNEEGLDPDDKPLLDLRHEINKLLCKEGLNEQITLGLKIALFKTYGGSKSWTYNSTKEALTLLHGIYNLFATMDRPEYLGISHFMHAARITAEHTKDIQAFVNSNEGQMWIGALIPGAQIVSCTFPQMVIRTASGMQTIDLLKGENLASKSSLKLLPEDLTDSSEYKKVFQSARLMGYLQDGWWHVSHALGDFKLREYDYRTQIERKIDGKAHALIRSRLQELPNASDWQFWYNLEDRYASILIYDTSGKHCIGRLSRSGECHFKDQEGQRYRYGTRLNDDHPLFYFGAPLTHTERTDAKGVKHNELTFHGYRDEQNEPLSIFKIGDKWHLKNDPNFFISDQQEIKGIDLNQLFLVLENVLGETVAVLPVPSAITIKTPRGMEMVKNDTSQPFKASDPLPYLVLKVINREIVPQSSSYANALLAHSLLMQAKLPQDYRKIIEFMKSIREFRRFTEEELKFLGLIAYSVPNNDPETKAIQLYATYLMHENLHFYPIPEDTRKTDNEDKLTRASIPDATASSKIWADFIQEECRIGFMSLTLLDLSSAYLAKRNNVPDALKIETLVSANKLKEWGLMDLSFTSSILAPSEVKLKSPYISFRNLDITYPGKESFPHYSTRLGADFKDYFNYLFKIAREGTQEERIKLEAFLHKFQFDNYENNRSLVDLLLLTQDESCQADDVLREFRYLASYYGKKSALTANHEQQIASRKKDDHDALKRDYNSDLGDLNYSYRNNLKRIEEAYEKFSKAKGLNNNRGTRESTGHICRVSVPLPASPAPFILPFTPDSTLYHHFNKLAETYFYAKPEAEIGQIELFPETNETVKWLNEEYQAGYQQNLMKKKFRQKGALQEVCLSLSQKEKEALEQLQAKDKLVLRSLPMAICALGNRQLTNTTEGRIDLGGADKNQFTLEQLLLLALHPQKLQALTQLDIKTIQNELAPNIGRFLELGMRYRHTQSIIEALQELETATPESRSTLLATIQNLLETPYLLLQQANPLVQLVFQHFLELNLREDQIEGLNQMILPGQNAFIQRATGAGKTLIFGQLLAAYKADGKHLSVHVSPTYQYASQIGEMADRSKKTLDQEAQSLIFHHAPEYFNTQYLGQLNKRAKELIEEGGYFNTTITTLRALRAAYISSALDFYQNPSAARYATEKDLIRNFSALLRSKGLLTFDEVHDAQNPKSILNKGTGDKEYLHEVHLELMSWMLRMAIEHDLVAVKENRQAQTSDKEKQTVTNLLVKLLTDDKEWLAKFDCQTLSTKEMQELQNFMLNSEVPYPAFIQERIDGFKRKGREITALDHLLLCRQLIAGDWLFDAFSKSVYEHHGIIRDAGRLPISIPFSSNLKPSKTSEFSDPYRMGLNTLIAYQVEGINESQIMELIESLRTRAGNEFEEELERNPFCRIEETISYRSFATLLKIADIHSTLFEFSCSNAMNMLKLKKALQSKYSDVLRLLSDFVAENILKRKGLYTEQISCNGMNTATMGKSVSGFSATIDNPHIAPVMDYKGTKTTVDKEKGIYGQRIDQLIRKHRTTYVMGNAPQDLFEQVFCLLDETKRNNVRAVIDAGCHFRGIQNIEVAKMMCTYFKDLPIEGVIFYDLASDRPYFMLKDNVSVIKPVYSFNTKEIKGKTIFVDLNIPVDRVAVFYSQDKATGTNIPLMKEAVAISTVTENTKFFNKLQGDGRMRQMEFGQEIITAVQQGTLQKMALYLNKPELKELKVGKVEYSNMIRDIILYTYCLRADDLQEENFLLCMQNLQNTVQQYLLDKVYAAPVLEKDVFTKAASLFKETIAIDFVREYGMEKISMEMGKYLDLSISQSIETVNKIALPQEEIVVLKKTLEMIKEEFVPDLSKEITVTKNDFSIEKVRDGTMVQVQERDALSIHDKLVVQEWLNEGAKEEGSLAFARTINAEMLFSPTFAENTSLEIGRSRTEKQLYDHYSTALQAVASKPLNEVPKETLEEMNEKCHRAFKDQDYWCASETLRLARPYVEKERQDIIDQAFKTINEAPFYGIYLEDTMKNTFPKIWNGSVFSPEVLMTQNYFETRRNAVNLFDDCQKPVFHVLLIEDNLQESSLKVLILDSSDTKHIAEHFDNASGKLPEGRKMWLLRSSGDLGWPGPCPYDKKAALEHKATRRLLVQVNFFAGNLQILEQRVWQQALKEWLSDHPNLDQAISLFENLIMKETPKEEYLKSRTRKLLHKLRS